MTTETGLTLVDRAIKALDVNETALRTLVTESADIKTVTNPAGFSQAQTARMKLRGARINVEKLGKSAREDAQAFSKAIIEQEKKYIGIVSPEEARLQCLQDQFTAKIEAVKQAKIDAEIARKAHLQDLIDALDADLKFGDTSEIIERKLAALTSIEIDSRFEERREEAAKKHADATEELRLALQMVLASEKAHAENIAAADIVRAEAEKQRKIAEKAALEVEKLRADREAANRAIADAIVETERKVQEKIHADDRAKRIAAEKEAAELRAAAKRVEDAAAEKEAARAEAELKAASAPDKERMLAYAAALITLAMPEMSTAIGKETKLGIEQSILNLHKRIVAKAEEL